MVEITGGSPERVEVNLRVAAGELTQVFEQISGVERFNDYIGWVNRHVRMLAGQVSQRDIDDLLQTRGYWSLRGGDPVTLGNNLAETIRREIEYQRHALLLAADEIRSDVNVGMGRARSRLLSSLIRACWSTTQKSLILPTGT